jgi:LacI family repressor for deo operon, udp, cdd, tsx, nupC, and nupG
MSGVGRPVQPGEVNMADVAREAGVSIATVSRALREVPGVSRSTRTRIRQIAHELSYVISPEASALSRGHTGRVAIVMPQLDAWFYSAMLASMAPVLRDADLDVLIYEVAGEEQRTRFLRELPARRKADAVILTALPMAQAEVEHVQVDDLETGRIAVQHLVDLGHRRVGMIRTSDTDGTTWSSDVQRTQAWRETLEGAGLTAAEELLVTETYGVDAGARGMARLLTLDEPPTAVFAYSDEIAFAAVTAARDAGLRVPEDISVIGIDGHPLGELLDVTTVDQDVAGQGRAAAELVVQLISGEAKVTDVDVAPRLVVRGSTAPPPG